MFLRNARLSRTVPALQLFVHKSTSLDPVLCEMNLFHTLTAQLFNILPSTLSSTKWSLSMLKSTNFWDITPCSPLSVNRQACHLPARWFLAELIFTTLKMEVICCSETSVDTQRTTRRYIPEVGTLHNHRCKNLKSFHVVCRGADIFAAITGFLNHLKSSGYYMYHLL
jgi:hypothetical protein